MPKATATQPQTESIVRAAPAPYLPFLTFQGAIAALEHGIPKNIDRTMWPSQSGLVQTQILMAFRFFGLVDDEDCPTDLLYELVEEKDRRPATITKLLNQSYTAIIDHDLTKMTPKMVDDAMEQYNVTGETKRKAVTFFLRAAKFTGMPMHPLLSAMVRNTGPRKKRAKKGVFIGDMNGRAELPPPESPGANKKTIRLSGGGTVSLVISADPFTLPSEDRQFVFDLVDKLQAYAQAHPADDGDDGEEAGGEEENQDA
jgi:hypothetical protein